MNASACRVAFALLAHSIVASASASPRALEAFAFSARPDAAHSFVAAPPAARGAAAYWDSPPGRRAAASGGGAAPVAPPPRVSRALSFHGPDAHGGHVSFESHALVRPEVVSLDELPFALAVTCEPDGSGVALALAGVGGEGVALSWAPGTLLVGGPQWGCAVASPEDASSASSASPFYLRVLASPRIATARGGILFHGRLDVALVTAVTERASLAAAFDSLSFTLSRTGAVPGQEPRVVEEPSGAGGSRRASGASPIYAPLAWGFAQPGMVEAAAVWNVKNATSASRKGPAPINDEVDLGTPSGGHKVVCKDCYAYMAVDVRASAVFEWNVAKEVEVTATLHSSSAIVVDAAINNTDVMSSDGSVPGSWSVPLLGSNATEWTLGGVVTDNSTAGVLLFTMLFSIQGVPVAVPVRLSLSVDIQASFNNTGAPVSPAPIAILQGGGMVVTGTSSVGARYTPASGWQSVRAVRGWNVNAKSVSYDIPIPSINPSGRRGLFFRTALTANVNVKLFGGWTFSATTSSYTAALARPGCARNDSYNIPNSYVPVGLTDAVSVYAEVRYGAIGTMVVGDPFSAMPGSRGVDVVSGPACSGVGCSNALHSGLLFPSPPGAAAVQSILPLTLGPFALLPDEPMPPGGTWAGCVQNHKAYDPAMIDEPQATDECVFESDPFDSSDNTWSVECGNTPDGKRGMGGYKYADVRCRVSGTINGAPVKYLQSYSYCDPANTASNKRGCTLAGSTCSTTTTPNCPFTWTEGPTSTYCGLLQVYPGAAPSLGLGVSTFSSSCPVSTYSFFETNFTIQNFTVPLGRSTCRWSSSLGQFIQGSCTPTPTSMKLNVCGNDATCRICNATLGAAGLAMPSTNPPFCFDSRAFPTWALTPSSMGMPWCDTQDLWPDNPDMTGYPLDGGLTAMVGTSPLSNHLFSLDLTGADTVTFIITFYSGYTPKTTEFSLLPNGDLMETYVSLQNSRCVDESCALPGSLNGVVNALPGGTYDTACPDEGAVSAYGCLVKIITVPVGQTSPSLVGPAQQTVGSPRAYLNVKAKVAPQAIISFTVQGVAYRRATSIATGGSAIATVVRVAPMGSSYFSYRPAPGATGMIVLMTQLGSPIPGGAPDAFLLAKAFDVTKKPAWPRAVDISTSGVVLGLPTLMNASYALPRGASGTLSRGSSTASATVGICLMGDALILNPSGANTNSPAEQLITVASMSSNATSYFVNAFDLFDIAPGAPTSIILPAAGKVAYRVIPALSGATALNVTLFLQTGSQAEVCVAPGMGTFNILMCATANGVRGMKQLTVREGNIAWSSTVMTILVLAQSDTTAVVTSLPYVPLDPGAPARAVIPAGGAAFFAGVLDRAPITLPRLRTYESTYAGGGFTARVDTGNFAAGVGAYTEIDAFAGAGMPYQITPPFAGAYEASAPAMTAGSFAVFGAPFLPPNVMPPVIVSVFAGPALSASSSTSIEPEAIDGVDADDVPGPASGVDPTGSGVIDSNARYPSANPVPAVPVPAARRMGGAVAPSVSSSAAAAPVSLGTARSLQAAASMTTLLTPGSSPMRLFYFPRLRNDVVTGLAGLAWMELAASGAACFDTTAPTVDASESMFFSFGTLTCSPSAPPLMVGSDGLGSAGMEFLVALPASTALRAQVRTKDSKSSWSLCADPTSAGLCSAPAVGTAPYVDFTACGVAGPGVVAGLGPAAGPGSSVGTGGAMRFVRLSLRRNRPIVPPGASPAPQPPPEPVTIVLASSYAGVDACPSFTWRVGLWGPCSDPCNAGFQVRPTQCIDSHGNPVDASLCPFSAPLYSRTCNLGPCTYDLGAWSECSVPCLRKNFGTTPLATGLQFRKVSCKNSIGMEVAKGYCALFSQSYTTPPYVDINQGWVDIPSSQICVASRCDECPNDDTGCTAYFTTSAWGSCSAPCGGGFQTRIVECIGFDKNPSAETAGTAGALMANDYLCYAVGLTKPPTVQQCNEHICAMPDVTVSYADVRTLSGNLSVKVLSVPGGSSRFFSLPFPTDRPRGAGVCINVETFPVSAMSTDSAGCSERALSEVASCASALSACLMQAESLSLMTRSLLDEPAYLTYGSSPGFAPALRAANGAADTAPVCACYAAAQTCLATQACAPAPWQAANYAFTADSIRTACLASQCGAVDNSTACLPVATPSLRSADSVQPINIYASFQLPPTASQIEQSPQLAYGAPQYAPASLLPVSRATSDVSAESLLYAGFGKQALYIAPSEIPINAGGIIFSVSAPIGSIVGTLNASVLYPTFVNRTYLPVLQPQTITASGNFSDGALIPTLFPLTTTQYPIVSFRSAPNISVGVPTNVWNDTTIAAGNLQLFLNLTCGAFVDPSVLAQQNSSFATAVNAASSVNGASGGALVNAILGGITATPSAILRGQSVNSATTPSVRRGWNDVVRPFLLNSATPYVSFTHLSNFLVINFPPLPTTYAPTSNETLSFTIPGAFLVSGRDTLVPNFKLLISVTGQLGALDCIVGPWSPFSACAIQLQQTVGIGTSVAATCGTGVQTRTRASLQRQITYSTDDDWAECPPLVETRPCNTCDPCAEVPCVNGGMCVNGACVCPVGFSGIDCSLPPANPVVCSARQTGPWTSCGLFESRGLRNRTVDCSCSDGSLTAMGKARPGPYNMPSASASPFGATASPTGSITPSPSSTLSGSSNVTSTGTSSSTLTPSGSPSVSGTPTSSLSFNETASVSPTFTPSSSGTTSESPTTSPTVTPTTSSSSTVSVSPLVTASNTPTGSDSGSISLTPSTTESLSATLTPSPTATLSFRATPSNTPWPSPDPSPNVTNATVWAPAGCGTIPVPAWIAPCPLGTLNTTVVQVSLPITGLNASKLLSSANVWDAWSSAVALQLAAATAIPPAQLQVVFASRCPPPPMWIGISTFNAYLAAPPLDCITVEFVEEPGSADFAALRLTAKAALYRIACALGASADATLIGTFLPLPLSANGITPASHLLGPLWNLSAVDVNGNAISPAIRFSAATWRFTSTLILPRGAAPSIIPNQVVFPGRFDGRLIDLPYLQLTTGQRANGVNPDNVPALQGSLGTFILLFVALGLYVWYERNKVQGVVGGGSRNACLSCLALCTTSPLRAMGLAKGSEVELTKRAGGRPGSALATYSGGEEAVSSWQPGARRAPPVSRTATEPAVFASTFNPILISSVVRASSSRAVFNPIAGGGEGGRGAVSVNPLAGGRGGDVAVGVQEEDALLGSVR